MKKAKEEHYLVSMNDIISCAVDVLSVSDVILRFNAFLLGSILPLPQNRLSKYRCLTETSWSILYVKRAFLI